MRLLCRGTLACSLTISQSSNLCGRLCRWCGLPLHFSETATAQVVKVLLSTYCSAGRLKYELKVGRQTQLKSLILAQIERWRHA